MGYFKRETFKAGEECIGERPRSRGGVALENIESRSARLAGDLERYRTQNKLPYALSRR